MGLQKIAKMSLVDDVARQIREMIQLDGLVAGDRLPSEPEMLKQLGVSLSVLREALGQLRSIGLLTVQHGQVTYVADCDALSVCIQFVRSAMTISSWELIQFTELRAAISPRSTSIIQRDGDCPRTVREPVVNRVIPCKLWKVR